MSDVNKEIGLYPMSGDVVRFVSTAKLPIGGFETELHPIQDLHGEEYPFPAGAKNKIPLAVDTIKYLNSYGTWNGNAYIYNGLTFTILTNSGNEVIGISVSGTSQGSTYFSLSPALPWTAGSIINGCPSGGANTRFGLGLRASSVDWDYANGRTITTDITSAVSIWFANGYVASNVVFKPMIRLSTETDATFAPYENICQILGHTEVNAHRTGKNVFANTDDENEIGCAYLSKLYVENFGSYFTTERTATGFTITRTNTTSVGFKILLGHFDVGDVFTLSFDCNISSGFKISRTNTDELPSVSPGVSYTDVLTDQNHIITCTVSTAGFYWLGLYETTTTTWTFTNVMLEEKSTASSYEPYNKQSVTYQLGQTVYKGTLTINEDGSGTIVATEGKAVYDGSSDESWGVYPTYKGFAIYGVSDMKVGTRQAGKSNYLRFNIISDSIPNAWNGVNNNSQYVCGVSWLLDGYETATVAERIELWRAYLADNPLEITYPLAEPVVISMTEQEVLETLYGNNNVWHDANGDTTVTYRADTKKYIDNKFAELQTLIANL